MRIRAGVAPAAARLQNSRYGPDWDFACAISDPAPSPQPIVMSGSGRCEDSATRDFDRSRHHAIYGGAARRSYGPWAIGTSFGTLRAPVARSRSLITWPCGTNQPICRYSRDGETRTRTGDTTIFRDPRHRRDALERPANRRIGVGRLVPDAFALGWVSACLGLRGRAEVPKPRHQARQLESAGVRPGPTTRWRPVLLRPVTVVWPRAGFAPMKRGRPHRVGPADRRPARMTQPRGDRTRQA